jgi:hypothetical protein
MEGTEMSALNISETEQLGHAMRVLTTVGTMLRRLEEGEPPEDGEVKWLRKEVKKAHDEVHTVRTMKGHYPS